MRLPRWTALPLLAALLGPCSGASSHSLLYFYTAVSEPGPGLPRFVVAGFVDGLLSYHYDSDGREPTARAPWIERAGREDPDYWDSERRNMQGAEAVFRANVATAMQRYNQSAGLHTFQVMYGCDLSHDAPSGGFGQYGYDGRDFIAFDKETLSWTAAEAPALVTKSKWDADSALNEYYRAYLEEICPEWLRKYLDYGREALLRTVPPEVKVTRRDSKEGLETLLCQAHGFYPKQIDVTWRKNGTVTHEDTFHGVVSPNSDGTYYTWLSIEIDPQERSSYRCRVEHDGLPKPLDLAVAVEKSVLVWVIAGGVIAAVVLVLVVAGVIIYVRKRSEKAAYKPASSSDQGSDSSSRA